MPPAPASILESWTVVLVLRSASLSMVAVANVNETLPSLSFLSSSGFLAIVPSTSARLTYFFVFRIMSIGVVDILDVDVFGGATDAIVCLDVNACCINVVVGIKGDVVATEC
ncbi:hypothetical protein BSPWISOXPB_7399 [uncultured Gammaproteobacteria bacterium]|nr:hypothetical protein BSPWISOXPB_7399 [uncultured Gammaproteobacteria bacterium]